MSEPLFTWLVQTAAFDDTPERWAQAGRLARQLPPAPGDELLLALIDRNGQEAERAMEFDLERTMRQHGGRCQTRNGFRAKVIALHGDQLAVVVTKHGSEMGTVYQLSGRFMPERDSDRDLVTLTGVQAWLARLRAVTLKR